jgi:hypothetical protein
MQKKKCKNTHHSQILVPYILFYIYHPQILVVYFFIGHKFLSCSFLYFSIANLGTVIFYIYLSCKKSWSQIILYLSVTNLDLMLFYIYQSQILVRCYFIFISITLFSFISTNHKSWFGLMSYFQFLHG